MPLTILPKLLPIQLDHQLNRKIYHHVVRLTNYSTSTVESEYTDTPIYPPIEDVTFKAKWRRKKTDWHKKIEMLPTMEQKLVEMNMPKYFGFTSTVLSEERLKPFSLEFVKFITRTKVLPTLPLHYYENEVANIDGAVDSIKDKVAELIIVHFGNQISRVKRGYKAPGKLERKADETQHQNFILDLNNLMMKSLDDRLPHLSALSLDLRPRIEGFWWVGGFKHSYHIRKTRANFLPTKCIKDEPRDQAIHSTINPALVLRTGDGLPEVVALDGDGSHPALAKASDDGIQESVEDPTTSPEPTTPPNPTSVDPYQTDSKSWGFLLRRKRATIIPGFWPGVKDEHGHLFFHSRERQAELVRKNPDHGRSLIPNFLQQKAVLAGFTQALAYAFYQGFTPVNELTYPVVQQYVSTDGQMWQFGVYQMNTSCFHTNLSTENPRVNLLWLSDDMKLFDDVEGCSVKGLNDDVIRLLVSMYLKKGAPREDMSPYMADYKYLMNHSAPDEYKEEFQRQFLRLTGGRLANQFVPEILPWEKIYKVKFKTRHLDKKLKYFENRWDRNNPHTRRLDEYPVQHIPKVRRINFRIHFKPRLNSEHLFKHDWKTLQRMTPVYDDDEVVFKTMNIRHDIPPYYNGLLWSRAMIPTKMKI